MENVPLAPYLDFTNPRTEEKNAIFKKSTTFISTQQAFILFQAICKCL